jgi:hypothetical protein
MKKKKRRKIEGAGSDFIAEVVLLVSPKYSA